MAENKGITEVEALRAALAGDLNDEVIAKINHMIEVRSRKRVRKPDDSKRLANIALGEQFAEGFNGETFKASDVASALGVSVAKASAICKAMGWEKVPTTEKVAGDTRKGVPAPQIIKPCNGLQRGVSRGAL